MGEILFCFGLNVAKNEDKDGTPCKLKEEQELGTPKPELGLNLKELKDEVCFSSMIFSVKMEYSFFFPDSLSYVKSLD